MPFGVTPEGFVIKPLENILQEIKDKQLGDIDPALDQTATGPLGQLNGIMSAKLRENWELNESVYNATNPDAANDASLDNAAALCPGIIRESATKSTVTARCNLEDGTYAVGDLIANVAGNAEARFVNTEEITVTTGPDNFDLPFEAEDTGAVAAPTGTLSVISEPVTGWNSVTNLADAALGSPIESNADFRLRREQQIQFSGSGTVEGIRADILAVEEIISAVVIANDEDVAVGGLVPHSIHAIIWDGAAPAADDAEIAAAIFGSKASGIDTNGATSETVEDSMGNDHTILFDRAGEKVLEIQMTAVTDDPPSNWMDTDGPLISALIAFVNDDMNIGFDAIYFKLSGVAADFEWLIDFTLFEIRFSGDAFGVINLPVLGDERVTLDSGDVSFV